MSAQVVVGPFQPLPGAVEGPLHCNSSDHSVVTSVERRANIRSHFGQVQLRCSIHKHGHGTDEYNRPYATPCTPYPLVYLLTAAKRCKIRQGVPFVQFTLGVRHGCVITLIMAYRLSWTHKPEIPPCLLPSILASRLVPELLAIQAS